MKHIDLNRGNLKGAYEQALRDCPLLARLGITAKQQGWEESEILMIQVIVSCESNKSYAERLKALENGNQVVQTKGLPIEG